MIMDLELEYQTFMAKPTESLPHTYTRYMTLLNKLANDGVNLSKHEINVWFHEQIFQENHDDEVDERCSEEYLIDLDIKFYERGLFDEEEVSNDDEVTQVKVLTALADDKLTVGMNHTRNGYNHEMVPKSKDWFERLNPDNKLLNFNTGRILVPERQAINESLKPTETPITPESSKDSKVESLIPLPLLKNIQGASPSLEGASSSLGNAIDLPTLLSKRETKLRILYCMIRKKEDHWTSDHERYIASLKRSENFKAQPYQYVSPSKQILKAKAKPFQLCTHCSFNDHIPDDCRNYLECEICRSYDHFTSGYNHVINIRGGLLAESSQSSESSIGVKCNIYGSTVHSTTNHNEFDHFKRSEKIQATKAKETTKKSLEDWEVSSLQLVVPQTLEYRGGQLNAAPVLEVENFTNWKTRFMCHIIGIEPQFENIISNGPFVPMVAGQRKPKVQWIANERKAKSKRFFKNGTQRFSSAKATDQTECHKCGKKGHFARDCWSKTSVPSYQSPFQPKLLLSSENKPEMRNTKDFEAKYNKVKAKLALLSPSTLAPSSFSSKNKGLIAESHDWDEEEVSSDDEETKVKALMALTDEERIYVGKELRSP
nr:hypothetical protein [Tanacetum cinerariifolium]